MPWHAMGIHIISACFCDSELYTRGLHSIPFATTTTMASSFRHSRRADDYEDDDDDYDDDEEEEQQEEDDDDGTEDGASAESSPGPYDLELHSMTAKGIKHLCSELLEINKASQEDFQRNVHLTYLTFLRLFQEASDLEKDVSHLKRHAMAHRSLVQDLTDSLYSSIAAAAALTENPKEKIDCSTGLGVVVTVDELDVLLSEHRMDQAMELLELEGQALEKMQQDGRPARVIAASMSALSARKAKVADRLAALADNPRTPRHELLRALSGLCRLGDAQRANHLLFKFYRSGGGGATRRVDELIRCTSSSSQRNYIKELACTVFSSIVEASRSFLALHGRQPSPELHRWAREEIEDFGVAFHEYARSVSEAGEGLILAIEAANCALSYCSSMLRPLGIFLEEDLVASIQPSMEEVLAMYAKHLKQVVRLFVSSDAWVLGRFLMSGIGRTSPSAGAETEYCLLTTSGRKCVTLIQEVVEDVSPLLHLGMKSSVLQLMAELFREYMHSIVEVIPRKEEGAHADQQKYMWQLSVLINCTTLVALFPIIAHGVFKNNGASNQAQRELDGLVLFIKEAAGQVWAQFCQQFIRDTMSSLQNKPRTSFRERVCAGSPQSGMMPSFAFQVLFLRVRQLSNLYGNILAGKDGTMKKLLQELMEAMIIWLHNNLDSWIHQAQDVPKDTLFHQIQLDVHFLLELAQVGGFSSDRIRTSALDLLRKAEERVSSLEQRTSSSVIHEEAWATDAAKHAIEMLIGAEVNSSSSQEQASSKSEEDALNAGGSDMARNAQEGEDTDSQIDDSAGSGQNNSLDTWSNEHGGSLAPDETGCDGKSIDDFISIEDDPGAAEGSTEDGMVPESPLGSTQVLDSENGGDNIVSDHKLLKDNIPIGVHGDTVQASLCEAHEGGVPDTCLSGLGGSDAAMEATPCEPQDDDDDVDNESSCSFTTPPELLQDKSCSTPIPVVSEEMEIPDESVADTASTSSTEMGNTDQLHSDPGSSSSSSSSSRRPAAAEKGGGSRKKREGMSTSSRPRWK